MRELRRLCDKHNALLIVDEVQCGLGRTGKLFAHQNYDVTPDIMTLAKPLAGGLPIGAVLTVNKVAASVNPGAHGTTFGGNPLICSVANTVLEKIMAPSFLEAVQKNGKLLARGCVTCRISTAPTRSRRCACRSVRVASLSALSAPSQSHRLSSTRSASA
ncbi:hypothetical protein PINS_up015227 [Pythium insidiosum]|nr:hypothetical protein PINS_up015227 [Pythium insidiosum]